MSAIEITLPDSFVEELAHRLQELIVEQTASPRRWLTVRDAAAHLSLSQNSIRALIKRNRIPHYKVEGRILFEQAELDDWVRRGGSST